MRYDLLVLGEDWPGLQAALEAGRQDQRVAIVLPEGKLTATPALVQQVVQRLTAGPELQPMSMGSLRQVIAEATAHELELLDLELAWNGVELIPGQARFRPLDSVEIVQGDARTLVSANRIVIAQGTKPLRPAYIPFDGRSVISTEQILDLPTIPKSMVVIGSAGLGLAYGQLFSALGTNVTTVAEIAGLRRLPEGLMAVYLESGETLITELVVYNVVGDGDTDALNLSAVGIVPDEHGRLWCDERHQTWAPHVFAAGEVIGYPVHTTARS